MSFSHLGLSDKVLAAVAATGYTTPTPIQDQAIPHVLARRDVLGIAQTGTGKTAAFVLPMLTLLEKGRARARMPRTLILEPTRELAAQVKEQFDKYGAGQKLNVALLIGGVSFGDQDTKLTRGVDVLIATPGRLLDHTERGGLLLTGVELLVIDEADRMLDMGFIPDIERICKLVPFTRQTLFFTATMPTEIRRITDTFLHNPERIEVSKPATAAVDRDAVAGQLSAANRTRSVRCCAACCATPKISRTQSSSATASATWPLSINRFRSTASASAPCTAIWTSRREPPRWINSARARLPLLVASDVAARGLDIPEVSHVLNFDVPHHPDDYVHRIGRTGRAGRTGTAITIVCPADYKSIAAIEKLTGQTIPKADLPGYQAHADEAAATPAPMQHLQTVRRDPATHAARAASPPHAPASAKAANPAVSHGAPAAPPRDTRLPASTAGALPMAAAQPPSIGRAPAPHHEVVSEPGDHSHLPAFLLRPIRARG